MSFIALSRLSTRCCTKLVKKLPCGVLQTQSSLSFSWFKRNPDDNKKNSRSSDPMRKRENRELTKEEEELIEKQLEKMESILKSIKQYSSKKEAIEMGKDNTTKIDDDLLNSLDDKGAPKVTSPQSRNSNPLNTIASSVVPPAPPAPPAFSPEKLAPLTESRFVPVFAITKSPLLLNIATSFKVTDRNVISRLEYMKLNNINYMAIFLNKDCDNSSYNDCQIQVLEDTKQTYNMGTYAQLLDFKEEKNEVFINMIGRQHVTVEELVHFSPVTTGVVYPYYNGLVDISQANYDNYRQQIQSKVAERTKMNFDLGLFFQDFQRTLQLNEPDNLLLMGILAVKGFGKTKQEILMKKSLKDQLDSCLVLLQEHEYLEDFRKVMDKDILTRMNEQQKKTILTEELMYIKKELGLDKDQKQLVIKSYQEKYEELKKRSVSPFVLNKMTDEITKLQYMDEHNAEYSYIRNYLDWLCNIPWGIFSKDQLDLKKARSILDEDHYGLKDVKQRILEFIAVGKLQGQVTGKVLCLVGPPGVGKTSIAKSVARALDREYYQFSVGGLTDISQIKGHRRTYIGSMPGKLVEALKTVKRSNPLILIDEIDKVKQGYNGDPSAALLEVLDPAQNSQFMDYYIDIPIDLSKCLFICTANDMSSIPEPLKDRMEVLEMHGYDSVEKLNIAKNYLDKKARLETGLVNSNPMTPTSLDITDDALNTLIKYYCREAGVRNLQKYIEKIYRNVALKITEDEECRQTTNWSITSQNLEEYVGKRLFVSDRLYETTPPGVVMGLAWTSMGGSTLYLECNSIYKHPLDVYSQKWEVQSSYVAKKEEKKEEEENKSQHPKYTGSLTVTGQLGSVMKESTDLAYLNARKWMQLLKYNDVLYQHLIDNYKTQYQTSYGHEPEHVPARDEIFNYLEYSPLHIHFPEGAVPKDGPSAGCTITCALLSKALNRPVSQDLSMTGEISLNGKVLPVGGIKEKVMAARRANVHTIIVPKENAKDVDELPEYNKQDLTFHYASTFEDVLRYSGLCKELFEE